MKISFLIPLVGLIGAAHAQVRNPLPDPAVVVDRGCGLDRHEGVLWGLGRDYKARFDADGVEFTPALGARAKHNMPLRFTLTAVGRGDGAGTTPALSAPRQSVAARVVRYHRAECVETYEVRPDGVEQSFSFAALPEGDGDLWVRGRIDTELQVSEAGRAGLEFRAADLGGVHIGAVTGVDAHGATAPGSMRWLDGELELRLPAAFVDRATLPLVLDPLIGTTRTVGSGYDDEFPDAAYSLLGGNTYLVVWSRRFSGGDTDIRGQRLDANDLSLVGGLIGIRTNANLLSDAPSVAVARFIVGQGHVEYHVVAWRERTSGGSPGYVSACTVAAATGIVSTPLQVIAGADNFGSPDVGGDRDSLGTTAILVYPNYTQGNVEATRVSVASDGTLSRLNRRILSSTGTATAPAISQHGGGEGRFLVVWSGLQGLTDVWVDGVVVDRFLNVLDRVQPAAPGGLLESSPRVDGDGRHWIVAWTQRSGSGPADVAARRVQYDVQLGDAYMVPPVVIAGASGSQITPSVTYEWAAALVAYATETIGSDYDARVVSIDQFTCLTCEGDFLLDGSTNTTVANLSAVDGVGESLVVWESRDASGAGQIKARLFCHDAGVSSRVENSACGIDAKTYATCPRPGNSGFFLRLEYAEPHRPALLVLSPVFRFHTCDTCIILDPFRALVLPVGMTDGRGNVDLAVPLSAAALSPIGYQFVWLPSGPGACQALGVSFSTLGFLGFSL